MGVDESSIAVIIPCLNEEKGIAAVLRDFRATLPGARLVVVDNGSTDGTADVAREAGADQVIVEPHRGKARAMITAFESIDADLVIMVDGDGSYPAEGARRLLEEYEKSHADMITGVRHSGDPAAFRAMHQLGTRAFEKALELAFDYRSNDVFSGLRLFSRRFRENVPILSRGFELELELTIQAIDKGFRMREVPIPFGQRAAGSSSKLSSVHDGLRILRFLVVLFRDYRPISFFGTLSSGAFVLGLLAGSLPIYEFIMTRKVGRFPLAFLAASLMVIAFTSIQIGLTIQGSLRYNREAFQVRIRKSSLDAANRSRDLEAERRRVG